MKLLLFLLLAFFCGIDGFALFAPYAAFVVAVDLLLKRYRANQDAQATAALQPIAVSDELEVAGA